MKYGLDVGIYGRLAMPQQLLPLAQWADNSTFDSIWLADHVVFPAKIESQYPYNPSGRFPVPLDEPLLEPVAAMGVLAGATSRVRIGTAVLVMPYRNPVLLAKMLTTFDVFSGGRIILGAGVGWMAEEFAALAAAPFEHRGRVTDEYIEIFKALCAGGEVSYDGEHYQLNTVHAQPPSVQRPHIPVVIGGVSTPALRRTARHGDGWLSTALTLERMPERIETLRRLTREQGRSEHAVELYHKLFINIGDARESVFGGREPGTGSAAQIIDDLKAIADCGYQHIIVRYIGTDADVQRQQLTQFLDGIATKL
ncbi:MAG: TIGR03619 family F420-dependent LLM class oxidoreductase [Chromatiales bacterium]|jgi:probable F420-dependent oxidoreductase|nr:TIGR03619 family F420-dependent LLM class oxidoreductase [Chromatiales bacterium]